MIQIQPSCLEGNPISLLAIHKFSVVDFIIEKNTFDFLKVNKKAVIILSVTEVAMKMKQADN